MAYPGALAFFRELDLGHTPVATWEDDPGFDPGPGPGPDPGLGPDLGCPSCEARDLGNLVFLSARPHVYQVSPTDIVC